MSSTAPLPATPGGPHGRHAVRRRHRHRRIWWAIALLAVAVGATTGLLAIKPAQRPRSAVAQPGTAPVAVQTSVSPSSSAPRAVRSTAARHRSAFSSGSYPVGSVVVPGRYRAQGETGYCAWLRLNALHGDQTSIIAFGDSENGAPLTVTVEPSDVGFEVQGNCTFRRIG